MVRDHWVQGKAESIVDHRKSQAATRFLMRSRGHCGVLKNRQVVVRAAHDKRLVQANRFHSILLASATSMQAKTRLRTTIGSRCVSRAPTGASNMLAGTIQTSAGR